jgi:prepilin-type N-terminal cleavage/methylation domain-containing protein
MKSKNSLSGFTLMELLIVVAILGVLLSLSTWSLNGYIQRLRLEEGSRVAGSALQRVGEIAIKRNQTLRLTVLNQNEFVWSTQSDNVELGRSRLPNNVIVSNQNPNGAIVFSGRGLPQQQYSFTLTRNDLSQQVTLLPTGLVLQ